MRRLRMFAPAKPSQSKAPSQVDVAPNPEDLSSIAQDYIKIGKEKVEPVLKDPSAAIVVTDDLKLALFAFKTAAELFEKIEAWDDAAFAWSMLKAVPVNPELKWGAEENLLACQRRQVQSKRIPHQPAEAKGFTV